MPRFIQHKTEAFWFYRFLSIGEREQHVDDDGRALRRGCCARMRTRCRRVWKTVPYSHTQPSFANTKPTNQVYDSIVNPGHWTEEMRADALEPAQLDRRDLKVGLA